ncbi:MerR family transcriptional regulator [Falsiroseomonas sp.]|uniref:MerR family transcriptional regulator n=1 Tax=Falsiroseomonas sp. TaxID=2870721 RepID=UPI003F7119E6
MSSDHALTAAEAARRLGVSAKALRLYERHGLVRPRRSAAGWRFYGPAEMARAAEVVALRAVGLSLAGLAGLRGGDAAALAAALAAQQAVLEARLAALAGQLARLGGLRAGLAQGVAQGVAQEVAQGVAQGLAQNAVMEPIRFALPWPWAGEAFALAAPGPLTWITGPLGSGKTRLARRLAEVLPGARFLGLDRAEGDDAPVAPALAKLCADGATDSAALRALLAGLAQPAPALVVDMVEQGLDAPTQRALAAHLRRIARPDRQLFLMTRSSAMLELEAMAPGETILFCPANHSPPCTVTPCPGAPGFEAVASCLGPPAARARSAGMVARLA